MLSTVARGFRQLCVGRMHSTVWPFSFHNYIYWLNKIVISPTVVDRMYKHFSSFNRRKVLQAIYHMFALILEILTFLFGFSVIRRAQMRFRWMLVKASRITRLQRGFIGTHLKRLHLMRLSCTLREKFECIVNAWCRLWDCADPRTFPRIIKSTNVSIETMQFVPVFGSQSQLSLVVDGRFFNFHLLHHRLTLSISSSSPNCSVCRDGRSISHHKITNDDVVGVAVLTAARKHSNKEELISVMMERLHNGYDTRVSMVK